MNNEIFISLSDYASICGLAIDEAREEAKKSGFYRLVDDTELVSKSAIQKNKSEEPKKEIPESEIERLKSEIESLKKQLEEKDRQLSDYSSKYVTLAEKALLLTEQAQQITAQAQVLHLQAQNNSKEERKELAESQPKERKASLFANLFKKK